MRADINVTPFIDVMLVLLIISMILMPAPQHSLDAGLPPAGRDPAPGEPPPPLVIGVGPQLRLNGEPVHGLRDLRERLQGVLRTRSDRTVFLRADGDALYGRVVEVLDTARDAGAQRLGLITDRDQPISRSTRKP